MQEQIVVVNTDFFNDKWSPKSNDLVDAAENEVNEMLKTNGKLMARKDVEYNNKYKQFATYCLLECKHRLFLFQRCSDKGEQRLKNMLSVGVGGHINSEDIGENNCLLKGVKRELYEEVEILCPHKTHFLGIINDESSEVSSVHIGICYIVELEEEKCEIKESDKMTGRWIDRCEVLKIWDHLENWSRILMAAKYGESIGLYNKTLNGKIYRNTIAKEYLCVPAVLKTILDSEGLSEMKTVQIADYFGVSLPKDANTYGLSNYRVSDESKTYGTMIQGDDINSFFSSLKIDLKEHYIPLHHIDKGMMCYEISKQLMSGFHVICGYDYNLLHHSESNGYIGHVSIIIDVENTKIDEITLLDPGPHHPGVLSVDAFELYRAIDSAKDGFWIIKPCVGR